MPLLHLRRGHGALADRALALVLRLLLAGVLCCPLVLGLYGLHIWWQLSSVGFSDDCLPAPAGVQQACVWVSPGLVDASWSHDEPCWQVYRRPC